MKKNLLRSIRSVLLFASIGLMHNLGFAQVKATVKINKNISYQKITGFGGFVNSPQFTYNHMSEAEIRKMWGANSEAGLNIMRLYIPTGESNWQQTVATAQLAKSLGIKIFASPWSMPTEWKTYNVIGSQFNDGTGNKLNSLVDSNYAKYANYLNNFVVFMRNNGVELDAISIQNEPDFGVDYAGCYWTPAQMTKFLKENRNLITCKVIAPETVGISDNYATPFNAADLRPYFDIYAGHQYGGIGTTFKNIQANGKEAWMTEYLINWNSNLATPRDFNWSIDAFIFANGVNDAMLANINAWIHYATKRYYGLMGDGTNGIPTSEITKRGSILSHFVKYTVGSTRIDATWNDNLGALKGSSYLSVTGDSIILMVINASANAYNLTVDLPFLSSAGKSVRTTATENMIDSSMAFTQTNRPKVSVGGSSFTTLVFTKSGTLIPSQMTSQLVSYTKIDSITATNAAFGAAYMLSGKKATFYNGFPLISANQNANNGYLPLTKKYNRLVFHVDSLTSAGSYTSANTTLYYVNAAGVAKSNNYGTITFNGRTNFDWLLDISENVLNDGCIGIIGLTNGNFSSILNFKFGNVFFAAGSERGYKFTGPYSITDGPLLDALDDTTYTSLDFNNVTGIPSQTNWDSANTNKNAVYYVQTPDLSNKNNIVYGTTCNNLKLRDMGGNFYPPLGFTAAAATYTGTLNGYKMLTLPFQANIPTGVKAYNLALSGSQINGTLISTGIIPSNTPVLVNGTGTFTFMGAGNISPLLNPQVGITNAVYIGIKVPLEAYYLKTDNVGTPFFSKAITAAQPSIGSFDAYVTLGSDTIPTTRTLALNDILPVTLGIFTAKLNGSNVLLDWTTYSEINNKGFDVERSTDGKTFEKIGFVKGQGNSNVQNSYTFTDQLPIAGLNYYRLKQTDIFGAFNYSLVKSVDFGSQEPSVTVYPNPVTNTLNFNGNGNKLTGTLVLLDAVGRTLLQSNVGTTDVFRLEVSKLPKGIYFYRLNNFKGTFTKQ